jgi:hypothetical protein
MSEIFCQTSHSNIHQKCELLLQWAKKTHWNSSDSLVSTSVPCIPQQVLLGKEWSDKYDELKKILPDGIMMRSITQNYCASG